VGIRATLISLMKLLHHRDPCHASESWHPAFPKNLDTSFRWYDRLDNFLPALSLFFISLILFTWGVASQEIVSFESRFYLFALEMWRHGITWFPTSYQQPYPDYPVTSTLLIYFAAKLFDGLNKFTAVLPSAIAAALTVSLTYLIGALHNKRFGWYAVLFLCMTVAFIKNARSLSLDMYPTAITALCFYCLQVADSRQKSFPLPWLWLLLAISFAFRGPIGFIMPAGVVCVYYVVAKRFKRCLQFGIGATLTLLLCILLLLSLAYHTGGLPFVHDVLTMQIFGRMEKNAVVPWYFYFTESFGAYALSFPVAVVGWISRHCEAAKRPKQSNSFFRLPRPQTTRARNDDCVIPLTQLTAWAFIILVGISIPGDKKIRYVLPMAPALALLASYFFMTVIKRKIILPTFTFIFIVAYLAIVEPIELAIDKTRDFVVQVESMRLKKHAKLVFYQEGRDGLPIKYLVNMTQEEQPIFIDDVKKLLSLQGHAIFIISQANFAKLPPAVLSHLQIKLRGKIGHKEVVVLE